MSIDGALCWHEWGLETQKLGEYPKGEHPVLDDLEVLAQTNPAYNVRLRDNTIQGERKLFSDDGFARERCGMWPKMTELAPRVIPQDAWETDTLDKKSAPAAGTQVAIALDVNPSRTAAAIGLAGRRADGLPHVEVVKYLTDMGLVVSTIKGIVQRNDPVDVVLDGASPANSFVTELKNAGIEPTVTGSREMAAACGLIYDEITGPGHVLRHRDDELLDDAAGNVAKRDIGDGGFGWSRRLATGDISPFVCITLARYGLATHEKPRKRPAPAPRALPSTPHPRGEPTDLSHVGF